MFSPICPILRAIRSAKFFPSSLVDLN
uniref:Uncharacterized protein n=1 Tax=Lepeophtheirus salmonis TaxID=72036 RepID=A0A0K2UVX1_LEPSM